MKLPDEEKLREAEELKERYKRLSGKGKYSEAAAIAERACAILEEEHGNESVELAGCLNDLGAFFIRQGVFGKAEPLYQRALAIKETALGPGHVSIATTLNNLAFLYSEKGEFKKAEPLYKRALTIREKALGPSHSDVAESLNNLASLYYAQGAYGKAEPLYERALAIFEKTLGADHPDVGTSLNNLASVYQARGIYEKAEPLHERALALKEQALGSNHPDVANSLNNLAGLYDDQGKYGKAKPLYERALAIREKALGVDHPDVALSLNNLASLYKAQGAYKKAEPLHERALAIWEKALGDNHPYVAAGLSNLASLYMVQGTYGKAEPLYERALAIGEKTLGSDHPNVAVALKHLADLYEAQGKYGKAEPLYERALTIWEKALGSDHPGVAASLSSLAGLYEIQGAYGKAEPLYERALGISEKAFGPDHPDVADTLNNLGGLYETQGAYEKAEPLCGRALAIREKALGPAHPLVAQSLNGLASLYYEQGEYGKAEPLFERALSIREKALDSANPLVAQSLTSLALLYQEQREYERAKPLFERALTVYEAALGPDHPYIARSLGNLVMLYEEQGNHDLAVESHRRALNIQETHLGRILTVADESRRLAYALPLSSSLYYTLSLHIRVVPEHDGIAELALTTLLRRKNRVQDLVAQSTAALRRSLPEDDLHLLDDLSEVDSKIAVLSNRVPVTLGVEAYSQQFGELRRERDHLWSKLAEHSTLVDALDQPITIDDIQRALAAGSALVELIQYAPRHDDAGTHLRKHEPKPPSRYAAYLVFPDRFDWVDLGPAAPIDEHVNAFRHALQTRQAIPTDLYDTVMRPIVEKLGFTKLLIIAPAGDLSLIPFGALHDGERYLVEKYDLRYVTTGRDLLAPPATPPVATTPVTIVANPAGANLPDAELEADFLASLFPHTRVLLDDQATETNVRTIERPLVLHMATHGFFGDALNERDNPLFRSGLYLADVDQVEVDRERDDGQLTAYEVSGMDLRGTQLVVLSACETGMGATDVKKTDVGGVDMNQGVFGLRRAFAMAGARTTVMSLWEVSGVTTQKTMEVYYRKLAEGMGRGEAMQAVQLEMLHSEEHAHPKDWAAFIVSGDDAPMVFPEGEKPREEEEPQGPPPVRRPHGCTVAVPSLDRDPFVPAFLLGLLGLGALRRRRA